MTSAWCARITITSAFVALISCLPAHAQDRLPVDVAVGWAPIFGNNARDHLLPAWAIEVSGGSRRAVTPVIDVSGWYSPPADFTPDLRPKLRRWDGQGPIAPPAGPTDWVELDPWGVDVAFARTIDLLRGHVARAYERAEAGA